MNGPKHDLKLLMFPCINTMNKDQLVAVLLTKEEIYTLRTMCHDSLSYWYNIWKESVNGKNDFNSDTCLSLYKRNVLLEEKITEIMYAVHPELTDAGSEEEEQEEDKVLETV